jgi:5,10-methylenetetrahydromethanopterin reductase
MVLAPQGHPFTRPLTRLREYAEVMRPLMRGESVSYAGQTIDLVDARIEDLLSGDGQIASDATSVPLYLGVTGAPALELAGELGDGVLLNVCLPTEYVIRARGLIEQGARRAGRDVSAIEIGLMLVVSPDRDSRRGKDRARRFIALYLSLFPNIARETGLPAEWLERLRQVFHGDGVEAAARLVDDAIVDSLTAAGTPEECQARIDEYRCAGVDLAVMVALDGAIEQTIDLLGPMSS